MTKLILASTSKIRHTILTNAGLECEAVSPTVDESRLKIEIATKPTHNLALELAKRKALSIENPKALIIGADQTLICNGIFYDKPSSIAEATTQLKKLRGQKHILNSAIAVALDGKIIWSTSATAELIMRNFSDEYISTYVAANEPHLLHCVGAYQLEGQGVQLFDEIKGDYFTILGLPLLPLLAFLRQVGFLTT